MDQATFDKLVDTLQRNEVEMMDVKRPAYTQGSEDVLANFKRVAARLETTPGQVLLTYFEKHMDAIRSALLHPEIPQAEEMSGRFLDARNYLALGYALLQESKGEPEFRAALEKGLQRTEEDLRQFEYQSYRETASLRTAIPDEDFREYTPDHDPTNKLPD